jgi:tetratricopeptide (TPR) repeat protein
MKKKLDMNQENSEEQLEIEQTDETEDQAHNFIQKYSKVIIIASVAVIALIAVLLYMRSKSNENYERASVLITRVLSYYEAADYQKALEGDPQKTYLGEPVKGLKFIAQEYSNEPGKIAAMYAGNSLISLNKWSEAKEYFEKAAGSSSKVITQGGIAGLGACLENEGKFAEAAEKYEEASKLGVDENLQSRYGFYSGLCFEKAGNKKKAEDVYRTILKSGQMTEFSMLAKAGLIRIGTIIE